MPSEVLRLAGVSLQSLSNGSAVKTVRLQHQEITKYGYEHLHGGLYLVQEDPALLVIQPEEFEQITGRVDVDLFFGVIGGV